MWSVSLDSLKKCYSGEEILLLEPEVGTPSWVTVIVSGVGMRLDQGKK